MRSSGRSARQTSTSSGSTQKLGVVLRLVGFVGRAPAREHELLDAVVDAELPPDTFTFQLPADEEVSGLGLSEAARLASFPVWALPRPAQQITFRPAGPARRRPESVTIEYVDSMLVEMAAGEDFAFGRRSDEPPRRLERGGRVYAVVGGELWFALDGTLVMLAAAGEPEGLVDVAESLLRVEA